MAHFFNWLRSSIGKKQVVGFTGLGISFFVFMHMSGNLLLFLGPKAYNMYGHNLTHGPAFPVLELLLLAAFVFHVALAIQLALANRKARPIGNSSTGTCPKAATFASRSMIYTGLLLLVFLVLHLKTFRFGTVYMINYDGLEVRDLYKLMAEEFQKPLFVAWYVFSLLVLGLHLSHGVSSLFQSMGFASARNRNLRRLSWLFAMVVAGGFITQPVWMFCCGGAK